MKDIKLSKDEATIICNAIYRYVATLMDDPEESQLMIGIYDKVSETHHLPSFGQRMNEKNDLFIENLPKQKKRW